MYNITNISYGLTGLLLYANQVTGDLFGWLVIFAIFITAFLLLSSIYPPTESFASASFMSTMLAVLFWIIGFIPDIALLLFGILSAASIGFLVLGSNT